MKKIAGFLMGALLLAGAVSAQAASGRWDNDGWIYHDSTSPAPTVPSAVSTPFADPDNDGTLGVDMSGATVIDVQPDACDQDINLDPGNTLNFVFYDDGARRNVDICEDGYVSTTNETQPRAAVLNRNLPDLSFEDTVILPFYDDLLQVADSEISYRTAFTCGGASCATVQWENMALQSNADARLTFQVTFSTDDRIIFHFLSLTGTGSDGRSATVGLNGEEGATWNVYSANEMNALAAGLVVVWSDDGDQDGLATGFEDADQDDTVDATETDPADADSDDDNVGDGGEVADGSDPRDNTDPRDPAALVDADGDGIDALDEAYLGTKDNDDDSDGDGLTDDDEIAFDPPTDPTDTDSDDDGVSDFDEDDFGSDPRDPEDREEIEIDTSIVGSIYGLSSARDGQGNFHIFAHDDDSGNELVYYMLDKDGAIIIDETDISVMYPPLLNAGDVTRFVPKMVGNAILGVASYEPSGGDQSDCSVMLFFRIEPNLRTTDDGDPADPEEIVTVVKPLPDGGVGASQTDDCGTDSWSSWDGHFDFDADGAGNGHVVAEANPSSDGNQFGGGNAGMYYYFDGRTGNILNVEAFYRNCYNGGDYNCHSKVRPRIWLEGSTAHVIHNIRWETQNYLRFVNGRKVFGPSVLLASFKEHSDVAAVGGRVFGIWTGGEGIGSSDGAGDAIGVTIGEIDPATGSLRITAMPDASRDKGNNVAQLRPISGGRLVAGWWDDEVGSQLWALLNSSGQLLTTPFFAEDVSNGANNKNWWNTMSEYQGVLSNVHTCEGCSTIYIYQTPISALRSAGGVSGGGSSGCEMAKGPEASVSLVLLALAVLGVRFLRRRKA